MFCRCRATVCSLITSSAAISRLVAPARHQAEHLALPGGEARPADGRRRGQRGALGRGPGGRRAARTWRTPRRARAGPRPRRPAPGRRAPPAPRPARRRTARRACATGLPPPAAAATPRRAAPAASSTAPRAWSATACSSGGASRGIGDGGQLAARVRGGGCLTRGEVDLHRRRQQHRPVDPAAALLDEPSHRRGRRRDVPLRQPQQREARRGLPARAARRAVRPLGGVQLAAQPVQLAQLVERQAERRVRGSASRWQARSTSTSASDQLPVGLQDLRPVHQALAAVGHQVRLGGAPAVPGPASTRPPGAGRRRPCTPRPPRSRRCR